MKLVVAGPATLSLLGVSHDIPGYPFPLIANLALEYAKLGHDVDVVTTSPGLSRTLSVEGHHGIKVHVVGSRVRARDRAIDLFRDERNAIARIISAIKPDIVHAHWTYEFSMGSQRLGVPLLITVHDWAPAVFRHFRDPYRFARLMMQIVCIWRASDMTAPSMYLAQKVETNYRKKCRVVANGLPTNNSAEKTIPNKNRDRAFRVGMLNSQNDPRKNIDSALSAWPKFVDDYPDAVLILGGADFSSDSELARQPRIAQMKNVEFVGAIAANDVSVWMQSLDVFLHPSLEESFGMVLVEAMDAGAVVIAGASSGAVPEVVCDAGYLIDVSNSDQIGLALEALRTDTRLRNDLRVRAQQHAQNFRLPKIAQMYLSIMSEIIERGR